MVHRLRRDHRVTFPPGGQDTATLDIIAQPATADFNDYDANHNVIGGSTERTVDPDAAGRPGCLVRGRWNNWTEGPIQFDNADPPPVIVLQDSKPTVSVQETTRTRGFGGQAANFKVSIPNAVDHDVAVFYNTVDGTGANGGTAPNDYGSTYGAEGDHTEGFNLGGRKRGHH